MLSATIAVSSVDPGSTTMTRPPGLAASAAPRVWGSRWAALYAGITIATEGCRTGALIARSEEAGAVAENTHAGRVGAHLAGRHAADLVAEAGRIDAARSRGTHRIVGARAAEAVHRALAAVARIADSAVAFAVVAAADFAHRRVHRDVAVEACLTIGVDRAPARDALSRVGITRLTRHAERRCVDAVLRDADVVDAGLGRRVAL